MLKCELFDGTTRYLNADRVIIIVPAADEGLAVRFLGVDGEVKSLKIRRLQQTKQGTWYE